MTALSLTPSERELLSPEAEAALDRLLDLTRESTTRPDYPHEYPPGYAEPINGPLPVELDADDPA